MKFVCVACALLCTATSEFASPLGWITTATATAVVGSQSNSETGATVATATLMQGPAGAGSFAWISVASPGTISWDVGASATGCAYGACTFSSATVTANFFDEIELTGGSGTVGLVWSFPTLPPTAVLNVPSQVTYGVPFDISIAFSASIQEGMDEDPENAGSSFMGVSGLMVGGSSQYSYQTGSGSRDGLSFPGFQGAITAVPEPASLLLAGAGIVFLLRRRAR